MKFRTVLVVLIVGGLLFAPIDTTNVLSGLAHHLVSLFQSFGLH